MFGFNNNIITDTKYIQSIRDLNKFVTYAFQKRQTALIKNGKHVRDVALVRLTLQMQLLITTGIDQSQGNWLYHLPQSNLQGEFFLGSSI